VVDLVVNQATIFDMLAALEPVDRFREVERGRQRTSAG
jgi:hypothetical protein